MDAPLQLQPGGVKRQTKWAAQSCCRATWPVASTASKVLGHFFSIQPSDCVGRHRGALAGAAFFLRTVQLWQHAVLLGLQTPLTLVKRAGNDGLKSTFNALANWRPWIPTKKGQVQRLSLKAGVEASALWFGISVPVGRPHQLYILSYRHRCCLRQAHQQGGAFLFQGKELVWQQYDEVKTSCALRRHICAHAMLAVVPVSVSSCRL